VVGCCGLLWLVWVFQVLFSWPSFPFSWSCSHAIQQSAGFYFSSFWLWSPCFLPLVTLFRLFPSTFTFRFLVYCWVFVFHFWIECSFHTTIFRIRNGGLGLCLHWSLFPSWPFMALFYPFTPILVCFLAGFPVKFWVPNFWSSHLEFFFFQYTTIIRSLLLGIFHSFQPSLWQVVHFVKWLIVGCAIFLASSIRLALLGWYLHFSMLGPFPILLDGDFSCNLLFGWPAFSFYSFTFLK